MMFDTVAETIEIYWNLESNRKKTCSKLSIAIAYLKTEAYRN